ncbi:hypothetical protein [Thioalkalivibrio paradoxus]|uniref:hypothetical protein n=1 Tax=Thioalkalivibrio paradoxus TaxID=108010 RepID=UPI0018DE6092|nr:hypothetical protein [Thioalkalivibrio paradoxus]
MCLEIGDFGAEQCAFLALGGEFGAGFGEFGLDDILRSLEVGGGGLGLLAALAGITGGGLGFGQLIFEIGDLGAEQRAFLALGGKCGAGFGELGLDDILRSLEVGGGGLGLLAALAGVAGGGLGFGQLIFEVGDLGAEQRAFLALGGEFGAGFGEFGLDDVFRSLEVGGGGLGLFAALAGVAGGGLGFGQLIFEIGDFGTEQGAFFALGGESGTGFSEFGFEDFVGGLEVGGGGLGLFAALAGIAGGGLGFGQLIFEVGDFGAEQRAFLALGGEFGTGLGELGLDDLLGGLEVGGGGLGLFAVLAGVAGGGLGFGQLIFEVGDFGAEQRAFLALGGESGAGFSEFGFEDFVGGLEVGGGGLGLFAALAGVAGGGLGFGQLIFEVGDFGAEQRAFLALGGESGAGFSEFGFEDFVGGLEVGGGGLGLFAALAGVAGGGLDLGQLIFEVGDFGTEQRAFLALGGEFNAGSGQFCGEHLVLVTQVAELAFDGVDPFLQGVGFSLRGAVSGVGGLSGAGNAQGQKQCACQQCRSREPGSSGPWLQRGV